MAEHAGAGDQRDLPIVIHTSITQLEAIQSEIARRHAQLGEGYVALAAELDRFAACGAALSSHESSTSSDPWARLRENLPRPRRNPGERGAAEPRSDRRRE